MTCDMCEEAPEPIPEYDAVRTIKFHAGEASLCGYHSRVIEASQMR